MSYILEALRKVETQHEHLPVHGLSSRRRYYSAMDGRALPRAWLLAIAAVAGASLSGGVAAYLVADNRKDAAPLPQHPQPVQTPSVAPAPPHMQTLSPSHRQEMPPVAVRPAPTTTTPKPLQPVHTAKVRMPGPRQTQPNQASQLQQGRTVAQEQPLQEGKPVDNPGASPEQEAPPETKQPVSPARKQETELASARPASSGVSATPPALQPVQPFKPADDPLDRIAPPKAVEVQPFRPNDVIRPPAARKRAAASDEPPLLTTLSSQFQSMVPKMAINAQVYSSSPRQRFVVINMKRYNEGQSTTEGVSIEAIRQQDTIFAYQGQRFRLGR